MTEADYADPLLDFEHESFLVPVTATTTLAGADDLIDCREVGRSRDAGQVDSTRTIHRNSKGFVGVTAANKTRVDDRLTGSVYFDHESVLRKSAAASSNAGAGDRLYLRKVRAYEIGRAIG